MVHLRQEAGSQPHGSRFVPEKRCGEIPLGCWREVQSGCHVAPPPRRSIRSLTSSHEVVAASSPRRSRRRSSSKCHCGTGSRSGCTAMRSHSAWTYSIWSSTGRSSKPGGGVRASSRMAPVYRGRAGRGGGAQAGGVATWHPREDRRRRRCNGCNGPGHRRRMDEGRRLCLPTAGSSKRFGVPLLRPLESEAGVRIADRSWRGGDGRLVEHGIPVDYDGLRFDVHAQLRRPVRDPLSRQQPRVLGAL